MKRKSVKRPNDIEVQKPYIQKMIEEETQLVSRSSSLYNFLLSKKFKTLDRKRKKRKSLYFKKYRVMQKYYKILHSLIDEEGLSKN